MLRKALFLLAGNATASLLSLIRNLLIARLIPVEDYGIAATFALVMTLVEMASALGLQSQIIQSERGDDPHFQAALQGFQALRGLLSATILFLSAGLIGDFLNLPELTWAYRAVAFIPLINGFTHFDIYRLNRTMSFGPLIAFGTLPMALTLAAVWPLVEWLGDWRVMLCVLLMQAATMAAVSHLFAERPYRIVLDPAIMRGSLSFGWPLLINNMLLFGVFQGDRLLVARELGPSTLAIFSMGVTLTLTPTLVMAKSLQGFFLPRLSAERDAARFDRLAMAAMQCAMLNAGMTMAGVFLLGPALVNFALGERYGALVPYLGPLAAVQALRVLKSGSSVVALSRGLTGNAMVANLFRVATLPVIWWALVQGGGLPEVIALAIFGETAGYAASLLLVRYRLRQKLLPLALPFAVTVGLMFATSGLPGALPGPDALNAVPDTPVLIAVLAFLAVQFVTMSELRRWTWRRVMAVKGE